MGEINIQNQSVPYIIKRSKKRRFTTTLTIKHEEGLVIEAPFFMPEFMIRRFIEERKLWIIKRLFLLDKKKEIKKHEYISGESFTFFDEIYYLRIFETPDVKKTSLMVNKNTFIGIIPSGISDKRRISELKDKITNWYVHNSAGVFANRAQEYADRLGVQFNRISVKAVSSIWGSCSVAQNLTFNWKLALAPRENCNYVIAHEVSHIIHKHHQRSFWECVHSLDSEYKVHKSWFKNNSSTLSL